ncbi:MAG TPA: hypothetical protein VMA36_00180 [Candidatus Limnocylindria bacterium]|nr:hypothetical protein [Candidatus Limnocylindria bacterium]
MPPFPQLDHLVALTDDVGLFQHATLDVPNRSCGYCTDDVGRALLIACDAAARPQSAALGARLMTTYLSYLHDAQLADGWFHGFMGYDRRWQDDVGSPDAVGRAVWGLGYAERHAPRATWRTLAGRLRARALPGIARMRFVRPHAYVALGLLHALDARPDDARAVRDALASCAASIADAYDAYRTADWRWCEDVMTYDNARLPEALLRCGAALDDLRLTRIGIEMLDFYVGAVLEDDVFVPVGSDGWYPRDGAKARRGQQPLEAAALIDAAAVALALTGEERWRRVAEIAFDWFHGRNTHGSRLAAEGGGCADGIDEHGVNLNMGAESTLAYLLSAVAMARLVPGRPLLLAR